MTRILLTVLIAISTALTAFGQPLPQYNPKALGNIAAAIPQQPSVKPAKPRKVLVFTRCNGFNHKSISAGALALKLMGEKTGAYLSVVNDDMKFFEADQLKMFDAVCFVSTTGKVFMPTKAEWEKMDDAQKAEAEKRDARLKKNLVEFVKGGGGLIGIHAATDAFYEWPEWGEMMGGYFNAHPWNEKVGVKIDDPKNPINRAFGGDDFEIADEIYQFRDPYSRKNLRVLLSLDAAKTDMTKKNIRRKDGDFAVSWVRRYGKGRVFYCSLGHRDDIFWNPMILQHYLDGMQYALGDLKADDAPSEGDGSTSLFDGKDLDQWDFKPDGWYIEDGAIAWKKNAGFIWSRKQYGDFVLDVEFKVSKGANSGIFIRTASKPDWLHTGIEVQVLDSHGKANVGKHDCGAIYDCLAPSANAAKPAGEWNHITITAKANRINVVLNDVPIIDMNMDEWTEAHKNPDGTKNKFNTAYKDMPRSGYLALQDHGHAVWYRNIRIRELD